jgi:acyl carrier protein
VGSQAQIVELLVEKYGVDASKVSADATMADLGLDSLSVAELVFDIEDLFSIQVDTEDAEFKTFGDAVALVDRYLQAKGG